jgi:hypothetical protein
VPQLNREEVAVEEVVEGGKPFRHGDVATKAVEHAGTIDPAGAGPLEVSRLARTSARAAEATERFDTHEELRARVPEFARTYNQSWLLERHAYRTPAEAREHLLRQALVT